MSDQLPSTKPYLIRAIHEWCCDNGFTPYVSVVVDASTMVPKEHVKDGQIVLNVGPDAAGKLIIDNVALQCTARFNGAARDLWVPIGRIAAIYARENGAGMGFEVEDRGDTSVPSGDPGRSVTLAPEDKPPPPNRPKLQRVK